MSDITREALAFDVYGTLVDPLRVWTQLEQYLPHDKAMRVAEIWRQKQLEYSFRLTAMQTYIHFEQVTRNALDYALTAIGEQFDETSKQQLMAQYNDLPAFPDVKNGLEHLRAKGHRMVVFSNGTPAMLNTILRSSRLVAYFQELVSVDEVRTYKPSPRVYQLVADKVQRPLHEVRLISSNPFDVVGAANAGMQATWINRSNGPFDVGWEHPTMTVSTLTELANLL